MENTLRILILSDLSRHLAIQGNVSNHHTAFNLLKALLNPRFTPVLLYRLSYYFNYKFSPLSKFFTLCNFLFFGLEISPKCKIGSGLYFPHTVGTVIGAQEIGENVTIYHNVTLGAKNIDIHFTKGSRPIVGDNVLIAAGAKLIGGILIGDNVKIGVNAVVIDDIPANSIVFSPSSVSKVY